MFVFARSTCINQQNTDSPLESVKETPNESDDNNDVIYGGIMKLEINGEAFNVVLEKMRLQKHFTIRCHKN